MSASKSIGEPQDAPGSAPRPGGLMSVPDAAATLRLSKMTVIRRITAGLWPSGRCGRKWLIPEAFVVDYVRACSTGRHVDLDEFAASWLAQAKGAA